MLIISIFTIPGCGNKNNSNENKSSVTNNKENKNVVKVNGEEIELTYDTNFNNMYFKENVSKFNTNTMGSNHVIQYIKEGKVLFDIRMAYIENKTMEESKKEINFEVNPKKINDLEYQYGTWETKDNETGETIYIHQYLYEFNGTTYTIAFMSKNNIDELEKMFKKQYCLFLIYQFLLIYFKISFCEDVNVLPVKLNINADLTDLVEYYIKIHQQLFPILPKVRVVDTSPTEDSRFISFMDEETIYAFYFHKTRGHIVYAKGATEGYSCAPAGEWAKVEVSRETNVFMCGFIGAQRFLWHGKYVCNISYFSDDKDEYKRTCKPGTASISNVENNNDVEDDYNDLDLGYMVFYDIDGNILNDINSKEVLDNNVNNEKDTSGIENIQYFSISFWKTTFEN